MRCEFTLMTIGDYQGTTPGVSRAATREPGGSSTRPASEPRRSVRPETGVEAQGDARKEGRLGSRRTESVVQHDRRDESAASESLFVPAAEDDDQQWEPAEVNQEDEAMLGWDASANNVSGRLLTVGKC